VCTYMKEGGLNELEQTNRVTGTVGVTEGRRYFPCGPHVGQPWVSK